MGEMMDPDTKPKLIDNLKPSASVKTRLLLAAMIWALAGAGLLIAGSYWFISGFGWPLGILIVIPYGVGLLKARYILDKVGRKTVARILEQGDDRCLGGAFSWKSWLLIFFMVLLGWTLRHSGLAYRYVGIIYAAIGAGLLRADRLLWSGLRMGAQGN